VVFVGFDEAGVKLDHIENTKRNDIDGQM